MGATEARARAQAFIDYCDGLEQAGLADYARRGRLVAADLIDALDELDAERSARRSIQQQRDRAVDVLGMRAYDALEHELEQRRAARRTQPTKPLDLTAPDAVRELTNGR